MKTKLITALTAGIMIIPLLEAADDLISRKDFNVPQQWVPKKFMKRDFWPIVPVSLYQPAGKSRQDYEDNLRGVTFQPTSGMSPAMRKTMELPAFSDAAAILPSMAYPAMLEKGKDGVWRYKYDNFVPKNIVQPTRPFFLNTMRLTRAISARPTYARLFYFDPFDHDMDAFNKWNQKYPQYAGTMFAGEWGNNALNIQSYSKHRNFQKVLSKDDYKNIEKTYLHNPDFKKPKDYIDKRLKPYFDRSNYVFPYPGKMVLEGVDNIAHLAAEWGKGTVGVLAMESSRPNVRWQMQMMHTRGTARQYDTHWAWYIASFFTGIDFNGKRVVDSECTAWQISPKTGPDCGLSLSLRRRVFFLSYFSGANYMQREDAERNFFDYSKKGADRWKPAAEGQMYIDFFNFTRKNPDRGTPYTPVAILTGRNRGTWRDLGNTFRFLPNVPIKHSDFMFNGFMASILPSTPYLPGGEYSLRNGKYGDGFDMLTPDSHNDTQFAAILNHYKAAILAGEYEETPARIKYLSDYVRNGGTLVVCSKQLENWDPAVTGVKLTGKSIESGKYLLDTVTADSKVKILLKDNNGIPLILQKKYGKGSFIIGTPRWFSPYFDEEFEVLASQAMTKMLRGSTKYPYAEWILDRLINETLPVKVSGNIQYGINKTNDGWWIYLINNSGVKKFPTAAPVFDKTKKSDVVIDLKKLEVASAKELFSEKSLFVKDGKITVSVDPGEIAVCKIVEKKKEVKQMTETVKMKTIRKFEFDIQRFPAVVFESDDWGSAQNLANWEQKEAFDKIVGSKPYYPKLENRKELLALFSVLEKHRGADGLKPVFTAFTCMGNPDYKAIRANNFTEYKDISVEHGFPPGWDGTDVVKTWKEGISRDVWHPEYHAFFHHISAKLWLKLIKEDSGKGRQARELFEMNNFSLPYHLPEYDGYTEAEAEAFIKEGFARFERIFGYRPSAAVTSDAYPWTIRLWAEAGATTACLTNFRLNNGEIVYYTTKPWNFQDPAARCGDYDVEKNIIYMTRNVWFEPHDKGTSAEEAFTACENNFTKYKDPAIIQPHRVNYSVFPEHIAEKRLNELDRLLGMLSKRGVYFLTTAELSDIYRQGYSKRKLSNGTVLRKWAVCDLDKDYGEVTELPSGKKVRLTREMTGNFFLEK